MENHDQDVMYERKKKWGNGVSFVLDRNIIYLSKNKEIKLQSFTSKFQ